MSGPRGLEALPVDVVDVLAALLTGFDLLHLSHASPVLYRGRLHANSGVWTSHGAAPTSWTQLWSQISRKEAEIPPVFLDASCKARYFSNTAFCFRSDDESAGYTSRRTGEVKMTMPPLEACENIAVTIDLWCALLPGQEMCGTLLTMQLKEFTDGSTTQTRREIVCLDEDTNLYCSLWDDNIIMKTNLETMRWYHLALTYQYDAELGVGTQNVYIDGELKLAQESSAKTLLPPPSVDATTKLFVGGACGVVKFGGLIDDCRVWPRELTEEQIVKLKNCTEREDWDGGDCAWSLKESVYASAKGKITLMQCTRPCERSCESVMPIYAIH